MVQSLIVRYVTELRLGLDHLESSGDIDTKRFAFIGTSRDSTNTGIITAAIEPRYHTVIFLAGGIHRYAVKMLMEVNTINFASYIKPPKILLNGIYNEAFPPETETRPFYKLLREPKQLSIFFCGMRHALPVEPTWTDCTQVVIQKQRRRN